jgi:hypothetical protein
MLKSLPLGEDIMVDTVVVVDVMTTLLKTENLLVKTVSLISKVYNRFVTIYYNEQHI